MKSPVLRIRFDDGFRIPFHQGVSHHSYARIGSVHAQGKFNEKVKIGDQAPAYSDLPGVDGKKHSLADLSGK